MSEDMPVVVGGMVVGFFLLAQEPFLLNAAGTAVLVAVGAYEWRRHFGTGPVPAKRQGDALPPSQRES